MADFDGDGKLDLYTGSFDGGLYVLAGKGGGQFAPAAKLLDKSGAVLRLGQYWDYDAKEWTNLEQATFPDEHLVSGAAVDWDADGDLDLVLGSGSGGMFLRRNLGSAKAYSYATVDERLTAEGAELKVNGHAFPHIADWDGDGRWDLISAGDNGEVRWWRNVAAKGEPRFAAHVLLVPASTGESDAPGKRAQATTCDLDADGKLDLLVGDYRSDKGDSGKSVHHGYVWWFRRIEAP